MAAVRAFSLACPADYCFITHCIILSFLANKREREREKCTLPHLLCSRSKSQFPTSGSSLQALLPAKVVWYHQLPVLCKIMSSRSYHPYNRRTLCETILAKVNMLLEHFFSRYLLRKKNLINDFKSILTQRKQEVTCSYLT